MVFAEVSIGFNRIEEVEAAPTEVDIKVLEMPREELFLAGKMFLSYHKNKRAKHSPLPDFFVGTHATISQLYLIKRDTKNYRAYFPQVKLVQS